MASRVVGTVDYSKWDNLDCSDSESSSEDENSRRQQEQYERRQLLQRMREEEQSDEESSYESDSSSDEGHHVVPIVPPPTLAALQRAWNTDTSNITRPCANCFAPNAACRCSRCKLVRYCNSNCQLRYHNIHKLECIDFEKHASYWGMFDDKKKSANEEDDMVVLRARRSSKRRRALQLAAAAQAIERARRARMARGGVDAKGGGGGKGKGAEEREETCLCCQLEFTVAGDGGVAFCCPTSHYMCNECCGVWVNSVMLDLDSSYPPKCPQCRALITNETVERQLTSDQLNTYRAHVARTVLKPGEELIECKDCGMFEVVNDDPVVWWCPHCDVGVCRVCNKNDDLPAGPCHLFDIGRSSHKLCAELREPKLLIEQAIEEGGKMRCPNCQLAGRKDDACTHMTCTKCSSRWCYVCGLDVLKCDKAPETGSSGDPIFLHNRDWERNEKRCPMYLTQILEVDLNWLGEDWENNATDEDFADDEKCLDYLHRFKTIKLLQEVREKVGHKKFVGAFVSFESIKNCGYTVNEVVSTETDHLIDRSAFILDNAGVQENHVAHQRQIGDGGDEDDEEVVPILEEALVAAALQRSNETVQEDDQVRQAIAESTADAGQTNHDVFRFGQPH